MHLNENGELAIKDKVAAKALNAFFALVFTGKNQPSKTNFKIKDIKLSCYCIYSICMCLGEHFCYSRILIRTFLGGAVSG